MFHLTPTKFKHHIKYIYLKFSHFIKILLKQIHKTEFVLYSESVKRCEMVSLTDVLLVKILLNK